MRTTTLHLEKVKPEAAADWLSLKIDGERYL